MLSKYFTGWIIASTVLSFRQLCCSLFLEFSSYYKLTYTYFYRDKYVEFKYVFRLSYIIFEIDNKIAFQQSRFHFIDDKQWPLLVAWYGIMHVWWTNNSSSLNYSQTSAPINIKILPPLLKYIFLHSTKLNLSNECELRKFWYWCVS